MVSVAFPYMELFNTENGNLDKALKGNAVHLD